MNKSLIKFNRVNGWTYKTSDNQFIVYNAGPNEWYSAVIDSSMTEMFGYTSVTAIDSTKQFHTSMQNAMAWVRAEIETARVLISEAVGA